MIIHILKIIPNSNGYKQHPLFFLFPSYWGYNDPDWLKTKQNPIPGTSLPFDYEDEDVLLERKEAESAGLNVFGLVIKGIHKTYNSFKFPFRFSRHIAIHELSFIVEKGQCLSLLGSNGAGKTSLMKILYGTSSQTSGYNDFINQM